MSMCVLIFATFFCKNYDIKRKKFQLGLHIHTTHILLTILQKKEEKS
jgi:hypothetical protein